MMRKLLLTTVLFLAAISMKSYSCSCSGTTSIESEINNSNSIILGRIISEEDVKLIDSLSSKSTLSDSLLFDTLPNSQIVKKFQVELINAYKGNFDSKIITIYTGRGGGDCGYNFEIGKSYIIYANNISYFEHDKSTMPYPKGKNIAWTNICYRTDISKQSEINRIEKYLKEK